MQNGHFLKIFFERRQAEKSCYLPGIFQDSGLCGFKFQLLQLSNCVIWSKSLHVSGPWSHVFDYFYIFKAYAFWEGTLHIFRISSLKATAGYYQTPLISKLLITIKVQFNTSWNQMFLRSVNVQHKNKDKHKTRGYATEKYQQLRGVQISLQQSSPCPGRRNSRAEPCGCSNTCHPDFRHD